MAKPQRLHNRRRVNNSTVIITGSNTFDIEHNYETLVFQENGLLVYIIPAPISKRARKLGTTVYQQVDNDPL